MTDLMHLLLTIDWVAVSIFLFAVAVLLAVCAVCSKFVSVGFGAAPIFKMPLPIPEVDLDFKKRIPKRRKSDRKNR